MLPDFPKSKRELLLFISKRISSLEKKQHPILAQIKTFSQHEGEIIQFEQEGFGKKTQAAEFKSVSIEVKLDEVPALIGEALDRKLSLLAEQLGALKMNALFRE